MSEALVLSGVSGGVCAVCVGLIKYRPSSIKQLMLESSAFPHVRKHPYGSLPLR